MEKLIGAEAIAEYMGISRSHFFKLKRKWRRIEGYSMPVLIQLIGKPPKRQRILWTLPQWIDLWQYQIQHLKISLK